MRIFRRWTAHDSSGTLQTCVHSFCLWLCSSPVSFSAVSSQNREVKNVSEPRLYLYRKAGREVWDAEMWLPDGRRRVWRTGITVKGAAMEAARVRLEALAAAQTVAPIRSGGLADGCAPAVSTCASAPDAAPLPEHVPAGGAMDAPASAGGRPLEQAAISEAGAALAPEEHSQALQTPSEVREVGALSRFDRWFFGDLASLWRARA